MEVIRMTRGLGKGLDSLIPEFYDENFDSNGAQSLEDMLSGDNEDLDKTKDDVVDETIESSEESVEKTIIDEKNDIEEETTSSKKGKKHPKRFLAIIAAKRAYQMYKTSKRKKM